MTKPLVVPARFTETTSILGFNHMAHEEEHHRITTRDLKEQLAKLPDDSRLAFMVDGTRGQFLRIAPSEIPGVEDVFVVHLHRLPNYPPLSR